MTPDFFHLLTVRGYQNGASNDVIISHGPAFFDRKKSKLNFFEGKGRDINWPKFDFFGFLRAKVAPDSKST